MKDEELNQLINSINEVVGDEVQATIADKLGELVTRNSQVQEHLVEQEKEITRLKETNEKLISANGALLQQVPTIKKEVSPVVEKVEPVEFDYRSAFDENGNII